MIFPFRPAGFSRAIFLLPPSPRSSEWSQTHDNPQSTATTLTSTRTNLRPTLHGHSSSRVYPRDTGPYPSSGTGQGALAIRPHRESRWTRRAGRSSSLRSVRTPRAHIRARDCLGETGKSTFARGGTCHLRCARATRTILRRARYRRKTTLVGRPSRTPSICEIPGLQMRPPCLRDRSIRRASMRKWNSGMRTIRCSSCRTLPRPRLSFRDPLMLGAHPRPMHSQHRADR